MMESTNKIKEMDSDIIKIGHINWSPRPTKTEQESFSTRISLCIC